LVKIIKSIFLKLNKSGNKIPDVVNKVFKILYDKKAEDLLLIDVSRVLTGICDYFILATGYTEDHLRGLSEEIEKKMKEEGILPHHIEGYEKGVWILMDYDDFVIHLFLDETRKYYDLESLWGDQKTYGVRDVLKKKD